LLSHRDLCLRGAPTVRTHGALRFTPQDGLAVRDRLIAARADPMRLDPRDPGTGIATTASGTVTVTAAP